jgi:guanylate kinase
MATGQDDGEELTGLEWEAEKAYIKATSPRSLAYIAKSDEAENDDFDWEYVATDDPVTDTTNGDNFAGDVSESIVKEESLTEVQTAEMSFKQFESPSTSQCSSLLSSPVIDETGKSSNLLVIYGPSGLGRTDMVRKMIFRFPQKLGLVISHTTRQPRPDEMYARDFYFVSHKDMLNIIKKKKLMEYVQIDKAEDNFARNTYNSNQLMSPRKSFAALTSSTVISPDSSDGYLYGTTWDAFNEARHSGKPWIVLNVSIKGAEQLKNLGIEGTYLLMCSSKMEWKGDIVPDHSIEMTDEDSTYGFLENYVLSLIEEDVKGPTSPLELVKDEWERVPNVQLKNHIQQGKDKKRRISYKRMTFIEMFDHFQMSNLSQQLSCIKPEIRKKGLGKLIGPQRVAKRLRDERNLIFAIALCKFSDQNPLHMSALLTIYRYLTRKSTPCPRYGPHWEDIGFQGNDPVDDLRGVGMLGLMQLLWFVETPHFHPVVMDIYNYSKCSPNPLPFCVISLNITCLLLQALREGYLSKECNKEDQVMMVFNNLYGAIFVSFHRNWKKHTKGTMELGMVLQDVGNFAKKNVRFMIREFKLLMEDKEKGNKPTNNLDILVESSVEFSPIDKLTF